MKLSRRAVLALTTMLPIVLVLSSCGGTALLNAVSANRHYVLSRDVSYGDEPRQTLDVYRAAEPLPEAPLVVFFYGGGWNSGSKKSYEFVASALGKAGYTVVIPDYRLYPQETFPAFVEDGAEAFAWIVSNAADYGADPGQIFLMGHSAGAHIAALLALDERYLQAAGTGPHSIRGLIGLSGPYDFLPLDAGYLEDVFPEPLREQSQPVNFVSDDAPPTLLIHGTEDRRVRIRNSESLTSALEAEGVPVELKRYEGVGHARVVAVMAPPLGFLGSTLEDCLAFMRDILGDA